VKTENKQQQQQKKMGSHFDIGLDEHFGVFLSNLERCLETSSNPDPEITFNTTVFQNPDHDDSDYEEDYARLAEDAEFFEQVGDVFDVSLELISNNRICWFRFNCQIRDSEKCVVVDFEGQEDPRLEEGGEEVIAGSDTLDTPPGHIDFMVPLPIDDGARKIVLRAAIADFADGVNVKLLTGLDDLGLNLIPAIFAEEYSRDRQILFTDELSLSFSREFDLSLAGIQKFKREMPTAFRYVCASECMTVLGEDSERSQLISVSVE
jgi:hypothetical protein